MKALIFLLPLICYLSACETACDVKEDIVSLRHERKNLEQSHVTLSNSIFSQKQELLTLNEKLKELKIYESGKLPKYILSLHIEQSHFTLDLEEHMKDAMNAIDFDLPVDRDFYMSVSKNQ